MSSFTDLISNVVVLSRIITPSLWPAARRTREQQSQRKADCARRDQRSDRIVLDFPRQRVLAVADGIAVVHILGVVGRLVGGILHRVLGLAVEVLRLAGHLAGAAAGL